jgi:hypothetical protein
MQPFTTEIAEHAEQDIFSNATDSRNRVSRPRIATQMMDSLVSFQNIFAFSACSPVDY